ncbi:MAG: ABC-2 type transport system ATP-binding protein [Phenylobacterium sp.]|jgi:ABC-2 type transport system ATP-binding protein
MLQISNINKTYASGVKALQGISLSIDKGLFGLLGPNGAGKSSLMRTIATLQQPDIGEIQMQVGSGEHLNWSKKPQQVRQLLGYLPQEFGVYPGASAIALLDHMAVMKGIIERKTRQQEVEYLLNMVNLWDHRNHCVAEFSGGMKQRFGIAQALLAEPELIIVDEPTSGLDPQERNRFHNLLADIGQKAVVILSTHIVEDVADLCANVAIMANGQIVRQGTPEQLIAQWQGKLWQLNIEPSQLDQWQNHPALISRRLSKGRFVLTFVADSAPSSQACAIEPTLEDVYFSVLSQA